MPVNPDIKERAIKLRQKGLSYLEISKEIHVAKSTLSLWLRTIKMQAPLKYKLQHKANKNWKIGAEAKRRQRIKKSEKIIDAGISEIKKISTKELFYMGIVLYWAEGAKIKTANISQEVKFSNSDPKMCTVFLKWLTSSLKLSKERIRLRIYIHESQKERTPELLSYWSTITNFPQKAFTKTCYTKTIYPRKKKRKNMNSYYGQLVIRVTKSTNLNRKITGWIKGIGKQYKF